MNGKFDFSEQITPLEEFRAAALDARPDLKAALQAVDKVEDRSSAGDCEWLGRSDVRRRFRTQSADSGVLRRQRHASRCASSIAIRARSCARNWISRAIRRWWTPDRAQVFSDVDSAYATIAGNIALLRPYKDKYLQQAAKVRDTISFAYQNGGASLLDFLSAQNDYRNIQLSYLNLVGSYMTAAGQMNLAVGKEVIP